MKNLKFGWAIPLALLTLMTWIDHAKAAPPLKGGDTYLEMMVGDTVTIVEIDSLEMYAECTQPALSTILTVSITSTSGGWFAATGTTALSANDIHVYGTVMAEGAKWADVETPPAISPGGGYLAMDIGLGVNLYGNDCLIAGRHTAFQGP